MDKLSIGRMAELNHTSVQTLRYYDKLGLLKPEFVDETTGYRYYSIKQCARLDLINYMKYLGMSLDNIMAWFDSEDIASIPAMLREHAIVKHLPTAYFCNVGPIIRQANLERGSSRPKCFCSSMMILRCRPGWSLFRSMTMPVFIQAVEKDQKDFFGHFIRTYLSVEQV